MQKVEIITKITRKELTKMERLEYENYKGCKDILTIDLHNDYTVIAIKSWNPDEHKYTVEFHLKENSVNMWELMENVTEIFDVDYKIINKAILKHTSTLLNDGFFDYYINRYEHDLKCFDVGYEKLEGDTNAK